jgi:tetratricopeptide (TPR) repeat protein
MAVELQPGRGEFRNNLGSALASTGNRQQAIEQYGVALQLNPDYFQAGFNLATTLAGSGRREDAIAAAKRALETAATAHDIAAAKRIETWLKKYEAQPQTRSSN